METIFEAEIEKLIAEVEQTTADSPILIDMPFSPDPYKYLSYPNGVTTDEKRKELVIARINAIKQTLPKIDTINQHLFSLIGIAKEKAIGAGKFPNNRSMVDKHERERTAFRHRMHKNVETKLFLSAEQEDLERMLANKKFICIS